MPKQIPQHFLVIYYPLKNKLTDKTLLQLRKQYGGDLVAVKDFYKRLLDSYKQGKPVSVWFLGDQRPLRTNPFWIKFLNQDTAFYLGPEKVARKYNHAVVFVDIVKVKRGFYEIEFDLLADDPASLGEYEVTRRHVHKLEQIITDRPEFWLWSHRRWKHNPPEHVEIFE